MDEKYEVQWPKDGLFLDVFAHEILSYRYNWHEADFEMNILLRGRAEFCRGGEVHVLEEDDVLLIDPGVGHGSFSLESGTIALVLHFSANAFKNYLKPGQGYSFHGCVSDRRTRGAPGYRRLRYFAAQLLEALADKGTFSALTAKASIEMILSTLCCMFDPQIIQAAPDLDRVHQEAIRRIISYLEKNYVSKITLEELSDFTKYNRTYLSTFFKSNLGMNFHEYLTRIRFQHALSELTTTQKNLTDVALDNGFPDLKTFNNRFRATFRVTPAEYRAAIVPARAARAMNQRIFFAPSDPAIRKKLREYLYLPAE